ncbi:Rne/Rng family ribonuclease [Arthrobacter sp. 260]|uniref:Rne/Rng family ribonuclease n=1 Tax=Arthrobacter sp. 260 TaxID=2735314 RepID=UPI001490A972|nr:Rne/Rng family ribonuclease [Arthrobacter sp. 260]NOJ59693.1 Rne/Rng family ribonuclease [Arthrobacter sp. 260]
MDTQQNPTEQNPSDPTQEQLDVPLKKAPRTRRKKVEPAAETPQESPTDAAVIDTAATDIAAVDEPVAPKRRASRSRKATTSDIVLPDAPSTPPTGSTTPDSAAADPADPADAPKAKAPARRRSTRKADAAITAPSDDAANGDAASGDAEAGTSPADAVLTPVKKAPRRRLTVAQKKAAAEEAAAAQATPAVEEAAQEATAQYASSEAVQDAAETPEAVQVPETPEVPPTLSAADPFAIPASLFHAPDLQAVAAPARKTAPAPSSTDEDTTEDDEDGDTETGGRRRRRNRRSRGKGRADQDVGSNDNGPAADNGSDSDSDEGVTSRRRRRRRRGDQDLELTGGQDDDPPNTVTRVRAPRQVQETAPSNKVTSVKGSTRLEAKKQRRRESRDTGRRRQVITEAEFLARRESVDRQMIVRQRDDRIQIAVLEDGLLAEHFVSKTQQDSLIGNVYLGKVQNVLPSMEAAFVDIGRGRNAVLYAGEVNWDASRLDGQPRRIELALKSGDTVLVQVTKDPVGHKGARLTSQISLPGRYLVYVPGGSMTGISRKLPDVERNRLKRILKDRLPDNAGVIVRTAAEGASEEELTHDINRLRSQWENIEAKSGSTKSLAPELLYGEPDLTIKVVRDVFNEDFSKLIVSGDEAWDTIEAYVMYVAPDLVGRLEKWTGNEDIFFASRIDEQIHKALDRKVFLPSGGSLVIDRTEAMTVVDVNTGKFTGSGGNLEETVTKNNLEAAEEVVRQLRLRDIGGIIVIDFIDMVLEANRDLVLRRMVECLGRDRTKHQVAEVTSLGLVQMTRKRMGTGLLEVFGENCEHCGGRGVVTHDEPVEHKRHVVSPDNHQQHLRQEKVSRSERKRNRSRSSSPADEEQQAPEAPQNDAERQARAEAARVALASIAAATHAAHEAQGHPAADEAAEVVLTINGETVSLPRAESSDAEVQEARRLTLDSLTQAFDRKPTSEQPTNDQPVSEQPSSEQPVSERPGNEQPASGRRSRQSTNERTAAAQQPARAVSRETGSSGPTQQPVSPAEEPRSPRRNRRRAGSPQGTAATATIERKQPDAAEIAEQPVARFVATAVAPRKSPAAVPAKDEPMILGVGVPASEL